MKRKTKILSIMLGAVLASTCFINGMTNSEVSHMIQYGPKAADGSKTQIPIVKTDTELYAALETGNEYHMTSVNKEKIGGALEPLPDHGLIRVPDKYREHFYIEISGTDSGDPKIYSYPNLKSELSTNYKVPDKLIITDINLYNHSFFKVKDENDLTWYINTNEVNWVLKSKEDLKVVGDSTKELVPDKVNLTLDPTQRTNLSYDDIHKLVAGTGLEGVEQSVIEAENRYGVNALFTLAVAANESGWGSSYLANNRNNLFGICAYDSDLDASKYFPSKGDCVLYFADLISSEYFANGRTDLGSINDIYASSTNWQNEVGSIMGQLKSELEK